MQKDNGQGMLQAKVSLLPKSYTPLGMIDQLGIY